MIEFNKIYCGDAAKMLHLFPDNSIDCVVTSPPYYGLRNYNVDGQIGLEESPEMYIERLMNVFRHVKRVLKPAGTFWLNIGDSYAGSGRGKGDISRKGKQSKAGYAGDVFNKSYRLNGYKNKDLIGVPWQLAFALRADGWYLRQDIIWHKPNPMPESIRDRCTKAHEYIFLLTKSARYYFDYKAILEPAKYDGRKDTKAKGSPKYAGNGTGVGAQSFASEVHERWPNKVGNVPYRNKRSVWSVPTRSFRGAHFATYPEALIIDCIKAGCPTDGVVLDPFFGAGTTGLVARNTGRNYIGIELNPDYVEIAKQRLNV